MVLVTGASGFIGKHVVRTLLDNHVEVLILTRSKESYNCQGSESVVEGDLLYYDEWKQQLLEYSIDTCIHLAWMGIPDYSYDMSKDNIICGFKVLELCRDNKIQKLIVSGSCWEYNNPQGRVFVEDNVSVDNYFKIAKNSLLNVSLRFCKENDIRLNWLRLFYVYGEGQKSQSLIPHIIESFERGNVPVLNGAYNKNDFVYVGDVAKVIYDVCVKDNDNTVINVGMGKSIMVLDIVKAVAKAMNIEIDQSIYTSNGKEVDYYADYNEMNQMLGWVPNTPINIGIKQMINKK
ncbi:MAG: NAD(P)-dependent oxidoreductase [Lachnospiraceae bacterium]|nr:NAD(P)-dependent oxidoreductase [Lachnospiraceae bacterium]